MSVEAAPGLWRLTGVWGVNVYLWRPARPSAGEPILFDCGWPWSGRGLIASLAVLGCSVADIRTIAITHCDFDHVGRLASLVAASRAEVIAHELEASRLASDVWRRLPGQGRSLDPVILVAPWACRRYPHRPVQVSRPVRDGDQIGGWTVVHTPGHTPGHAAYFHPATRTLIAGDALGSAGFGRLRLPERDYAEDWPAAVDSVRKLADLQPETICFGHGPELRNAASLLHTLAWKHGAEGHHDGNRTDRP